MLCGADIGMLRDQFSNFRIGKTNNYFFIYGTMIDDDGEYITQIIPDHYREQIHIVGVLDNETDTQMEPIGFDNLIKKLGIRFGHLVDFRIENTKYNRLITAVDVESRMKVLVAEHIITRKHHGPINPEYVRKITGMNMKQRPDGWSIRHYCFFDIYNEFFDGDYHNYESLPYSVQPGPNKELFRILKQDGFTSFCCKGGLVAMVNLELKRVTTAQAPVKHTNIDNIVHPYEEFMEKIYIPWREKQGIK